MDPTIGRSIVAVVWMVVIMTILQPAIVATTPKSFSTVYFGVINSSSSNLTSKFSLPIGTQANSSYGFSAAANTQQSIGPALIYAAFGQFFNSLLNIPRLIYILFLASVAYPLPVALPFALISVAIIGYLTYPVIGFTLKGISYFGKTDIENVGGGGN